MFFFVFATMSFGE